MAQVKSVTLKIPTADAQGSGEKKITVIVSTTLGFETAELGRDFKLRIALYGSDTGPGERPPLSTLLTGPKPLYVFRWNVPPFPAGRDYIQIRAAQKELAWQETREVTAATLDEDRIEWMEGPEGSHFPKPNADEIQAVVTLSTEATSNIVVGAYAE